MMTRRHFFILLLANLILMIVIQSGCASTKNKVTPEEARSIAKEAYVYGFPMVDGYRINYAYHVDETNPEYKGPFNRIRNLPKVYTPEDKAVQTPNSDTPYSMLGMDLRSEPLVLTVPELEPDRYYSIQLVDLYTFNFDYIGSRTTGNEAGSYLVAGPGWNGQVPDGIRKVFRCETDIAIAIYRTQLFNPGDLENVIRIQEGYKVHALSEFLGQPAPPAAGAIDFLVPLSAQEQKTSLEFFDELSFILQFCPTHPSETGLMDRFARIGIVAGQPFDTASFSTEVRQALHEGINDAWQELDELEKTKIVTGQVTSGEMFGTREFLDNNYLYRFTAAVLGIYGNSKEEAMYPIYKTDAAGQILDGSTNRYTLHFAPGEFPPVHAFWSFTMYELPASLLVANPLNRYLINSPMLPDLKKDPDGGITLYIQSESPGKELEPNWLPAPNGPFMAVMRLYWPKEEALNGTWKEPPLVPVE